MKKLKNDPTIDIKLDDKSKVKLSKKDAERILKNLERVKPAQRGQVQKAMQKDKKTFNKYVKILNV